LQFLLLISSAGGLAEIIQNTHYIFIILYRNFNVFHWHSSMLYPLFATYHTIL